MNRHVVLCCAVLCCVVVLWVSICEMLFSRRVLRGMVSRNVFYALGADDVSIYI